MALDESTIGRTVDRCTIKSVTKLVLVTLGLLGLLAVASVLPGVDRVLLDTGVTFIALADAVVTLAIVVVLVSLAPRLATAVRTTLEGPREAVEHVASTVYWFVALVAVLVAHWGFAPLGTAVLGGNEWLYDLVFLLAALVPLTAVVVRLSAVLDPAADAVADTLAPADQSENGNGTPSTAADGSGGDATDDGTPPADRADGTSDRAERGSGGEES